MAEKGKNVILINVQMIRDTAEEKSCYFISWQVLMFACLVRSFRTLFISVNRGKEAEVQKVLEKAKEEGDGAREGVRSNAIKHQSFA